MLFASLLVFFFSTLVLALKTGDFVRIDNPSSENHGLICIVENPNYFHPKEPEIERVTVFAFYDADAKKYGEPGITLKKVIKYLALLESQLKPVMSSFLMNPLPDDERLRLSKLILKNAKGDTESFCDPKIELKHRLIGAWIDLNFGFNGMVAVCNSFPYPFKRSVEFFWNNIGVFQG